MYIWKLDLAYGYAPISRINWPSVSLKWFRGQSLKQIWTPLQVEVSTNTYVDDPPQYKIGDYLGLSTTPIVFSKKAIDLLQPIVFEAVEILPLNCNQMGLSIINVIRVIDCLDETLSEFVLLKDIPRRIIMDVPKYVFKYDCLDDANIFKLPQLTSQVFVSDKFKDIVERSGLTGFEFREVWNSEKES